jgi:alpha-glucosidase (family GH31 glycosyl hydrolase)
VRLVRAPPLAYELEIVVTAPGVEISLFAGEMALEVVRRYNLYCGGGTLPPRWGLGFWHCVPTHFTAQEVLREAAEIRARDFPCDVIGLEPGWHSKSYPCTYVWSPERFPDSDGFLAAMEERGSRLYDDDGATFAYERGEFRWRTLEVTVGPDGAPRGTISEGEPGWRSSYGEVVWRFPGRGFPFDRDG